MRSVGIFWAPLFTAFSHVLSGLTSSESCHCSWHYLQFRDVKYFAPGHPGSQYIHLGFLLRFFLLFFFWLETLCSHLIQLVCIEYTCAKYCSKTWVQSYIRQRSSSVGFYTIRGSKKNKHTNNSDNHKWVHAEIQSKMERWPEHVKGACSEKTIKGDIDLEF